MSTSYNPQDQAAHLQAEINSLLLSGAREALEKQDFLAFDKLMDRLRPAPTATATATADRDDLSPHEKYLDRWRIWLTVGLMAALFLLVGLVSLRDASSTASPYVSLLSGLAGISLGWMFANGSTSSTTRQPGRPKAGKSSPAVGVGETGQTSEPSGSALNTSGGTSGSTGLSGP